MRLLATLLLAAVAAQNPQLSMAPCSGGASQQFFYDAANSSIILASSRECIDILAWGTTPGSEAYTAPCHHEDRDPAHQNQAFSAPPLAAPGAPLVYALNPALTLDAAAPVTAGSSLQLGAAHTPFYLRVASPANGGTGALVHAASGLCVDAGPRVPPGAPAVLRACLDDRAPFQVLDVRGALGAAGGAVALLAPEMQRGVALCLAAADQSPAAALVAAPCAAGDALQNFTLAQGRLQLAGGGAVDTLLLGAGAAYEGLATALSAAAPAGEWALRGDAAAARLAHAPSGLCLDLGRVPWGHGCLDPAQRALPYCDASAALEARVADLLARLTVAEKVALTGSGLWSTGESSCDTIDPGVPRLSIPPKQWLVETNSMAASQCYGAQCATVFPSALNLGASGNRTLWREKGRVLSDEMRALNNLAWHRADGAVTYSGLNGFGPDLNQPRDPRNGRQGELVSEDPFLTAEYAVNFLNGMQIGEDPKYAKMTCGVKHFAG